MTAKISISRIVGTLFHCRHYYALRLIKTARMNIGITKEYLAEFHSAAASGNSDQMALMLRGSGLSQNLDVANDKGWTALMFAARNGHSDIVRILLDKGCDKSQTSESGQTALDFARFWNHKKVIELLEPQPEQSSLHYLPQLKEKTNFFAGSHLDRAGHLRRDDAWLKEALQNPASKFVVFSNLQPLMMPSPQPEGSEGIAGASLRLCTGRYAHVSQYLEQGATYVFLGLEKIGDNSAAWFAIDLSSQTEQQLKAINPEAELYNPIPEGMQLAPSEAGVFAQGRSMLAWHQMYGFCSTCGSKTKVAEAGYKRVCSNSSCKSLQGVHNTSYPRLDPSVIMAVSSPDGQQLLLGRGRHFPSGMFSCLAGFMEPGESIEDACRREVYEESGVQVGRVTYHSSQPWPMPSSLMIGCLAFATNSNLKVDKEELEQARWFSRYDVLQMMNHSHPQKLYCPPPQAIANTLIKAWLSSTVSPANL